jgi:NCAIR mutase (PurE)-related protein
VVFGQGKTPGQIASIAERIVASGQNLLVTRTTPEAFEAVGCLLPDARFNEIARTITLRLAEAPPGRGTVVVAAAGTADLPVAEEAVDSLEIMGNAVDRLYDVGVAGLHRLLDRRAALDHAGVVIVVAGMEGALASVVGGLVDVPIVALPTSVGYGASFEGLAALLAMLSSCAPGIVTVNIDNGFGAGFAAARINALRGAARRSVRDACA